MCGRFNITTDADALLFAFEVLEEHSKISSFVPNYNISPSPREKEISEENMAALTFIPIIRKLGRHRTLELAIWPLVPKWSSGKIPKYSTANARFETVDRLASFRTAWKHSQRCLIPATGFYEWQNIEGEKRKQPWHISHQSQAVMGFAGLWERSFTKEGESILSCTIITTQANQMMSEIHNSNQRMPVIVDPDLRDAWFENEPEEAKSFAGPYPDGLLGAYPISTRVNNPTFDAPGCIEPLGG